MSSSHARVAPPERAAEISDGIYAWVQPDGSWWINNTGFIVASHGVISVDACSTEARTRAYLRAIAKVTDMPVRTLVNTHHHGDHTFGNYLFDTATVVGHENARAALRAWGLPKSEPYWTDVDWGGVELAPPFLTYRDGIDLWADEMRCEVMHLGRRAHTDNDSIVWIPDRKVLFSGDLLFNGGTPFLLQGSVVGARETVEDLRRLEPETIVPGHGPVCGPDVLDAVAAYLDFVLLTAKKGKEADLTPLDTARETDLGEFAHLIDSERIVGNLHRAYADLDGSAELDTSAALSDMVTYNGGQPLGCLA
jgi:cyclase